MTDRNCDDGLALTPEPAAIRDEQVERALGRLAARGDLTPRQRAATERLADRLTAELQELFESDETAGADETFVENAGAETTDGDAAAGEASRPIPLSPD